MKRIFLFLAAFAMFAQLATAQRNCGTMESYERMLQDDPNYALKQEEIESFTNDFIRNGAQNERGIITIPVVFHVVYNTASQNISNALIQAQLNQLNLDYSRTNSDWTNTPSVFQPFAGNMEIQFCLASVDPTGAPTTGIRRKQTTTTSFSTNDGVKTGTLTGTSGGLTGWSSSSYLNVWVCNLSGGVLGYAQFPGGSASTDGVVLQWNTVGSVTTPNTGTPYNLGRTATHEVGHWLNLRHIWGDANCGNDQVTDTPTQQGANYGCPTFPQVSCSNGPNGAMFMNYMDYTDDACMYMFSNGQVARANALFATGGARASLLNSNGCGTPSACAAPSPSAGSITTTSATISWGAVSGAASYKVWYRPTASTSFIATTTTGTSLNVTGLTAATGYTYQVKTMCATDSSAWSTGTFTTASIVTTCTDAYESNNTLSAARAIPANTNITAVISSSTDRDYFSFTTSSAARNIRIDLSNLPADYDVRLYNPSGTQVGISQNGGTTAEVIRFNNGPTGNYRVYVYGYNGAFNTSNCYTLRASTSSTAFRESENAMEVVEELTPTASAFEAIAAYPNPTSGVFTCAFNAINDGTVQITLLDITGREVARTSFGAIQGYNKTDLDLSQHPAGYYTVVLNDGTSRSTLRIAKQ